MSNAAAGSPRHRRLELPLLASLAQQDHRHPHGKPDEIGWRDYAALLAHMGAEIEHALMVQYLYAAWSLGGAQVPEADRDAVRAWQDTILSIAKEEMGHMMTVQNVITLIGGSTTWDRRDLPWDSAFYPFPFTLEPLTLKALARFVYAEAPPHWHGPEAEEIARLIGAPVKYLQVKQDDFHHVGKLYKRLIEVLSDRHCVPDAVFDEFRFFIQPDFAGWARNHGRPTGEGQVGWDTDPPPRDRRTPAERVDMLIEPCATRDQAVAALQRVAEQGEAPHDPDERSHFQRFLGIYRDYKRRFPTEAPAPYRPIASNPSTLRDDGNGNGSRIRHPRTRKLAALSDLRYRILLFCLAQYFRLARIPQQHQTPGALASLLQHSFVEMYALKGLANRLMHAPMTERPDSLMAGPPFQLPYTQALALDAAADWTVQLELVDTALVLATELKASASGDESEFFAAMIDADQRWRAALLAFRSNATAVLAAGALA